MKLWGVVGWKNTGKTGLMERLVAEFRTRGVAVSTIKHAHHAFDVDQPGKDSFRHRAAGASEVLVSSGTRWALMHELWEEDEPGLPELVERLSPVDLVMIEGFKTYDHPKIETYRAAAGTDLIAPNEPTIRAIASDTALPDCGRPIFDLVDTGAIADFIAGELSL